MDNVVSEFLGRYALANVILKGNPSSADNRNRHYSWIEPENSLDILTGGYCETQTGLIQGME